MVMYNKDGKKRGHAVALYSGGLDSSLAILLMQRQNIEVTALTFLTHFGCDISDRSSCGSDPYPTAEKFGFTAKLMHLGDKFVNIVCNPKYGHGKNMNPCIDCRILMLREAKLFMELINADFIITGEVLGQRPMSQRRDSMNVVKRDSDLGGLLVRPLSGKLFPETIPEKNGLIDRNLLEDISGRSRKRQMEMAKQFGLDDYPNPAGGCLLTDPSYSNRLKDLLKYCKEPDLNDINLLKVGRHFRLNEHTKVIVGRNEAENEKIQQYAKPEYLKLEALDTGSPLTLYIDSNGKNDIELAAAITARYSKLKNEPEVEVECSNDNFNQKIKIAPAQPEEISKFQIK